MSFFGRSLKVKKGSKDVDSTRSKKKKKAAKASTASKSVMAPPVVKSEENQQQPSRESVLVNQKLVTGQTQFNQAKWGQIRPFVTHILQLGVKGLTTEFQSKKRKINLAEDADKMKEFYRQNPNGLNRYKDVGCLDATRVKLKGVAGHDYIHANYVATPKNKKRFICAQAPTEQTISDFWHMVVQEKCEYILMLCEFFEKGVNKCATYWPMQNGTAEYGDVKVYCVSATAGRPGEASIMIVKNVLEITIKGQATHKCIQFRWREWPDRGVPEVDSTPYLALREMERSAAPILIHCSAGVGRTGTLVLIQHVIEMVDNGTVVNDCASLLGQLRTQRHNSIQTEHQYLFVHAVLLYYFNKNGFLDPSVHNDVLAFQQQYNGFIAAFK